MKTITWIPGSNNDLDNLYDSLRENQYNNKTHRLWKNYSKKNFESVAALTIHFDDNNEPELCSSILQRSCWPENTFRILNRMWKINEKKKTILKRVSDCVGQSAISQISWLKENSKYDLVFCSRETSNWEKWTIQNFHEYFSLEFKTDNYKYLTCENECDKSCWQKIIYLGDEKILGTWKRHL